MSTISLGINQDSVVVRSSAISIGSSAFGGTVAYILQPGDPGFVVGQVKGFVCGPDIGPNSGSGFWAPSNLLTGASATAIGTGLSNSNSIVSTFGTGSVYAARLCREYAGGGFNDWFLPSRDEMQKLSINGSLINLAFNQNYYTSSQIDVNNVGAVYTFNSSLFSWPYGGTSFFIRPIRNFTV